MDGHFEGLLAGKQEHHGTGEKLIKEADVRTSFARQPTLPVDWRYVVRVTVLGISIASGTNASFM